MSWRVHLLGDARLVNGERTITRFESRKVVALLARMALEPDRLHAREELAALLWPDADRRTGLERLRHILSSLQRQLSLPGGATIANPLLQIDRHGIRLHRDAVSSDVSDFEARVRQRRYAEAQALYTGDLLPGYYDDWIQEERERLRALFEMASEAGQEALPPIAPPQEPVRQRSSSRAPLPTYLTTFFGREAERQQLRELLGSRRLVTLLGTGGCGKTRLAVEVAREIAASGEIVVFVPLADCVDPAQIVDRLRGALQIPTLPGTAGALEQTAIALGDTPALLVLDNLEQLAAGAAEAVEALLERLPAVRCLATSRCLLHVAGEQAFPLTPLPVPDVGAGTPQASPCLALFIDRARAARPDFGITPQNREDLTALCRLLEGIPLALELAASRIRTYSVAEMRRQIEVEDGGRFDLLARPATAGRKDARHGSLRAALAWSWRRLPPRQQDFLAALSALRGRWTAATAAAISGASDTRALLEELNGVSLVIANGADAHGEMRFALLESVRSFAEDQLAPSQRYALRRAGITHALSLAQNRAEALLPEDLTLLEGALSDAIADGETDAALALCLALDEIWTRFGGSDRSLSLLQAALNLPGGDAEVRVDVLHIASYLACESADLPRAARLAAEAERAAATTDSVAATAAGRTALCRVAYLRRDPPECVERLASEALALAQASGHPLLAASALTFQGLLAGRARRFDDAEALLQAAQEQMEAIGSQRRANLVRINRANLASDRGDFPAAAAQFTACRYAAQAAGDQVLEARCWCNQGALAARQEHWEESLVALRECLRRARRLGSSTLLAVALWNLAEPLAVTGRGADAAIILAFVERYWQERIGPLSDDDLAYRERIYVEAQRSLPIGSEGVAALRLRGDQITLSQALRLALGE